MADRVSVILRLCGVLPDALLERLEQAILDDDGSVDWEGSSFSRDLLSGKLPLALMATEVAWGRFDAIEQFCLVYGLPFVRWSGGAAGSFPPERLVFTGSGEPGYFVVTEDDEVVISREDVDRLGTLEAVCDHFDKADFKVPALTLETAAGHAD